MNGSNFKLRRIIQYGNGFLPVIVARIEARGASASLGPIVARQQFSPSLACDGQTPARLAASRYIHMNQPIYRLKITLRGIRPPIWRRVEVMPDLSLLELHRVIQGAMGWHGSVV